MKWLRKQLDFDRVADRFVGYVDMGVEGIEDMSCLPLANEALVFMLVSLTEGWKIPLAYFLIAGLHSIVSGQTWLDYAYRNVMMSVFTLCH